MSGTNYKHLGNYIRPVDVRNKELKVTSPMGVNIGKFFMPSVANTIGTDLSKYKLVAQWQFACNLMHVGRDEALPIACNENKKDMLVSPAYHVFEIIDTNVLMPEFLTLLFKRREFDREAWFYTDGDVRQGLPISSLYNMKLPVPSIEEQKRIVAQYQAVEKRIRNNERLIAHLEDTAQAIFHHHFVESIDPNNLPSGWKLAKVGDFVNTITGKKDVNQSQSKGKYRFFSCSPDFYYSNEYIAEGPAILIAGNGSYTGRTSIYMEKFDLYQRTYACLPKKEYKELIVYLYCVMKFMFQPLFLGGTRGSSIPYIVKGDIEDFEFPFNRKICSEFSYKSTHLINYIQVLLKENSILSDTQSQLLNSL